MSKTFKYVKDFDFSSAGKTVGHCKGGVMKKAIGGAVHRAATAKGNTVKSIGEQEAAVMKSRMIPEGTGMHKDTSALGIKNNKNPGIARKGVPVAPKQPMIAPYKKGGEVKKMAFGGLGALQRRPTPVAQQRMANSPRAMPTPTQTTASSGVSSTPATRVAGTATQLQALKNAAAAAPKQAPTTAGIGGSQAEQMANVSRVAPKPLSPATSAMYKNLGINLKKGGAVPKAGAYKVPKVMSEFKSGELHSGSKSGPVVKSRKQAVAIALSEARSAAKKK